MYAAIWINSQPDKASERIVVCYPLLARQNAAIAVLRSQRRAGAASTILSADVRDLKGFLKRLEASDDSWDNLSDQELIDAIEAMANDVGVSVVEWDNGVRSAEGHIVTAVKKIPKPKFYPRFITPEGKEVWDKVLTTYKSAIDKYKSNKKQMWAAAIIMYQRACNTAGVTPFTRPVGEEQVVVDPDTGRVTKRHNPRKSASNEINKRANQGNHRALQETEKIFAALKKAKLASRLTQEKFYEVAKYASKFYITTYRWCKLLKNVTPNDVINELVRNQGYNRVKNICTKQIDGVTDLLIEPEGKDVYFFITTFLTRDQIVLLFGLEDEAEKGKVRVTDEAILKMLGKSGRKWVKTGVLAEPA